MEIEIKEIEIAVRMWVKTVRWNCTWSWPQRKVPPAAQATTAAAEQYQSEEKRPL